MRRALEEAQKAEGRTSPNPQVGCVLVKKGRIVAVGHHAKAGSPHAEIVAIQRAGKRAQGADVYVNLEPCDHIGRTGPCSKALIEAGVGRVYVGAKDPDPRVNGRGIRRLRRAGVPVEVGLLAAEAKLLNEAFEHVMRLGRPFVVAKFAQSIDGRIATRTGASKWITGRSARQFAHRLRRSHDAILVGRGTVSLDDPELTCRMRRGVDPIRIVLDASLKTSLGAKVVRAARSSKAPTWLITAEGAPASRRRNFEKKGVETIALRSRRGRIDLRHLLEILHERKVLSVLVEGGAQVLGSFFDARLVDKVHALTAPLVIGGKGAPSAVAGRGPALLEEATPLRHLQMERLGADVHLWGYPKRF